MRHYAFREARHYMPGGIRWNLGKYGENPHCAGDAKIAQWFTTKFSSIASRRRGILLPHRASGAMAPRIRGRHAQRDRAL
jgi:hypothetical protein